MPRVIRPAAHFDGRPQNIAHLPMKLHHVISALLFPLCALTQLADSPPSERRASIGHSRPAFTDYTVQTVIAVTNTTDRVIRIAPGRVDRWLGTSFSGVSGTRAPFTPRFLQSGESFRFPVTRSIDGFSWAVAVRVAQAVSGLDQSGHSSSETFSYSLICTNIPGGSTKTVEPTGTSTDR